MREITTLEATAVVGGMQQVYITRKKDDGGASTATLKGAVHNSGGGSSGAAGGGGGGGPKVTTTVTCVDTVEQLSQRGGPTKVSFTVQGVSAEQVPTIEMVKKISVCTTIKAHSDK